MAMERCRKDAKRQGFTILELLVVISIIAVIAAMATGGAIKAIKQARYKKVGATISALEMGLQSYRAKENKWPFELSKLERDTGTGDYWAKGKKNAVVFQKLLTSTTTKYLDTSALTTAINGRKSVKDELEANGSSGDVNIPIGYADPEDTTQFKYFNVRYYPLTDRVKVLKP